MERITLNIGLSVGDYEPPEQLGNVLLWIVPYFRVANVRVTEGTGQEGAERTVVVDAELRPEVEHPTFTAMAVGTEQHSIAVSVDGGEPTRYYSSGLVEDEEEDKFLRI